MNDDESMRATNTALRATVNAIMRRMRETDPEGLAKTLEYALEGARNLTQDGSREQIHAVNAIGLQLGGNG